MEQMNPGNRRSAVIDLPYKLAVNPNGRPVKVRLATNIANPVYFLNDGEWVLRGRARSEGWRELSDVCTAAEEKKIEEYMAFDEQHKGQVRPMPDSFVPAKMKQMRKTASTVPEFAGFEKHYSTDDDAAAKVIAAAKDSKPKGS